MYSLITQQISLHRARTQRLAAAMQVAELDKVEKLKSEPNLWVSLDPERCYSELTSG